MYFYYGLQGLAGNGYKSYPDTGVEVVGKCILKWERIKEFTKEAHRYAPDNLRLIG